MAKATRGWLGLSGLMAALALLAIVAVVPELGRSQVDEAQAWALTLSDDSLMDTAGQLSNYPMEYRRALIPRLSADQQAMVWQSHIRAYMSVHPALSARALASLNQVLALVTAELLSQPEPADLAALSALTLDLREEIGDEEAAIVLTMRGPSAEPGVGARIVGFLRQQFVVSARSGDCQCSTESDWCSQSPCAGYLEPGVNCSYSSYGCGTFLLYPCDGRCCFPDPEGGWIC